MKKLSFLSQSKSLDPKLLSPSSPWGFPSCGHIKTLSFRDDDTAFRTFNSAFLDVSSSSRSFSTMSDEDSGEPVETAIQGLRSDRFFFEPEPSSSLVDDREKKWCSNSSSDDDKEDGDEDEDEDEADELGYKESEMVCLESSNPQDDFKRSMEEMIEAHGLGKDWEGLEELLGCYLKINGKNNHGYILAAFIDLVVNLSNSLPSTSSPTTTITSTTTVSSSMSSSNSIVCSSPSSPLSLPSSSLTTPSLPSTLDHHLAHHDDNGANDDDDDDDNVTS